MIKWKSGTIIKRPEYFKISHVGGMSKQGEGSYQGHKDNMKHAFPTTHTLQQQQKADKPCWDVQWPHSNEFTSLIILTTNVTLTETDHPAD